MVWRCARSARRRGHRCIVVGRAASSPGEDGVETAISGDGELMSRMRGECALGLAWHRYAVLKLGISFGELSFGVRNRRCFGWRWRLVGHISVHSSKARDREVFLGSSA